MDPEAMLSKLTMDGQQVPEVDAADLARVWKLFQESRKRVGDKPMAISGDLYERACTSGSNVYAVWNRASMLGLLAEPMHLIDRWMHDGTPDENVFRVMAAIPMEGIGKGIRQSPPFDVEEFLRRVEQESEGNQECGTPQG